MDKLNTYLDVNIEIDKKRHERVSFPEVNEDSESYKLEVRKDIIRSYATRLFYDKVCTFSLHGLDVELLFSHCLNFAFKYEAILSSLDDRITKQIILNDVIA